MRNPREKPFTVWVDYGSDGWVPECFDTLEEVAEHIATGGTYGSRFVITKRLDLEVKEPDYGGQG